MGLGEWAALTAALFWTLSSMIWGQVNLPAFTMNCFKNWIGAVLVVFHLIILWMLGADKLFTAPTSSWFWLGLSGVIGIVIGDTFFFRSLQILGPRKALMLSVTAPLFSAVLASFLLNESLMFTSIIGVVITVAGVIVVVSDRKARKESPGLLPGKTYLGAIGGVLGAICQAVGSVFAKKGMVDIEGSNLCSAAEATFVRIFIAALVTTIVLLASRKFLVTWKSGTNWKMIRLLVPATALGTWIGIWLSQIAFQNTAVATAQTLMSTCPIFAIPIVWYLHKQRVTVIAFFGTLIAFLGIYLTVSS